jgi:sugar transferase (PEP-CTERM/EpsH1 system associated)
MNILFLSHCVPNPPDKGERIRSHFLIKRLARQHSVHLVCFARNDEDLQALQQLEGVCASVHAERLSPGPALFKAGLQFLAGGCLNADFYWSAAMQEHVRRLSQRVSFSAAVAFSVVMAPYVPAGAPYVLDMQDVDSEKWFQYGRSRWPGFLYSLEGRRLRRREIEHAAAAARTFLTTRQEEALFRSFAGAGLPTAAMENGVDFDYYDPVMAPELPELSGRRFLVFVGTMDYYPNSAGVIWFAKSIFPELRRRHSGLEFLIVGRNPGKSVAALSEIPGVTITGAVPDTRPYLKQSLACVAPLQIARGIQNKVLESLAMDKCVLSSGAICKTFGERRPSGIVRCDTAAEYAGALDHLGGVRNALRDDARLRFTWGTNLQHFVEVVESTATPDGRTAVPHSTA